MEDRKSLLRIEGLLIVCFSTVRMKMQHPDVSDFIF